MTRTLHCALALLTASLGIAGTLTPAREAGALPGGPGGFPLLFTVGSDAACTHSTLAAAVAAAAAAGPANDYIRVAKNHTDSGIGVNIYAQSVTIEGGFDDCGDSTPNGTTLLNGAGGSADSVLEIYGGSAADRHSVVLRDLEIRGGEADADGGGAIEIDGGFDVVLENVDVALNASSFGGGIHIDGSESATLVIADASTISNNSADTDGGGIYCTGPAQVFFEDGAIAFNDAGLGGGVHAASGCFFQSDAGGLLQGIYFNEATVAGGGIYLLGGTALLNGGEVHPASVYLNTAAQHGGGIAVDGGALVAHNAWINSNSVTVEGTPSGPGGGISVSGSGFVLMDRTLAGACHTPERCSNLSGNLATSGGAIYVGHGQANIFQTWIEGNSQNAGVAGGTGGQLNIEGSVITDNAGSAAVTVINNGGATLGYVTIADNASTTAAIRAVDSALGPAHVSVYSSIIYEDAEPVLDLVNTATATIDCVVVHESASLAGATRVAVGDPAFADPANGDFSLLGFSAAIDHCDTAFYTPEDDINLRTRGVDFPGVGDSFPPSPFDAGASEALVLLPEASNGGPWALTLAALLAWRRRRRAGRGAPGSYDAEEER
jgi:hypothetical protein